MKETKNVIERDDVVIRFSGDSGDGMQLTGTLFSDTSAYVGNSISTFPDFPAEIRAPQGTVAGVSGFQVHFGNRKINTPGDYCDVLVAMNPAALKGNAQWIKKGATVIIDGDSWNEKSIEKAGFKSQDPVAELGITHANIVFPDMTSMTKDAVAETGIDNKSALKCKNMFALGICFCIYGFPLEHTIDYINKKFGKRNPAVAQANILALKGGFNYAANTHVFADTYTVKPADLPKGKYRSISGNEAAAWGFMAAAEKSGLPLFCGSYPITPATTILEELSKHKSLGIKTIQAEDEIAGICTAIGAAFTGNLAVTTTSGPGLALKSEAMGLAVMTELPLVIMDVQRAGPSTGLPTKTEQSDLMQALWGRNGESPMVVTAASTPSNNFHYAFWSAKIALEHMTPVLMLSDGFLGNGTEPWLIPSMKDYPEIKAPILTSVPEGGYKPYKRDEKTLARNWAIPGTPGMQHRIGGLEKDALTGAASHDPMNHQKMVETRAAKVAAVADFIPEQTVTGDPEGDLLVVGWGSTYGHLLSAVEALRSEGKKISLCHFNFINPLPNGVKEIFSRFGKIVVCELNLGQFADYLKMRHQEFDYLKYNKIQGLPFTVDELKEEFTKILNLK